MIYNPIEATTKILDAYRRYLLTTFQTNIPALNKQLAEKLHEDSYIANGPFISFSKPYRKDKTLQELIESNKGYISEKLNSIIPFQRHLYSHQVKAIENAVRGKSIVVTTGTSSGKTECFLIPVINQLLKEKDELIKATGNPNVELPLGVRTLIIYPLNALVNDQLKRLFFDDEKDENENAKNIFDYLKENYPDIKVGMYIGATPEDDCDIDDTIQSLTNSKIKTQSEFKQKYPNIMLTRDEMRAKPPHILITNYTMLEYLLLRPDDATFFDNNKNANSWKTIVLDEAHSYEGSLGIEISTLLRRVKARINNDDIQFILTSATLGDESKNDDILHFANSICSTKDTSKEFTQESIVRAETYELDIPEKTINLGFEFYNNLSAMLNEYYSQVDDYDKKSKLIKIKAFLNNKNFIEQEQPENTKNVEEKLIRTIIFDLIIKDNFFEYLYKEITKDGKDSYTNRISSTNEEEDSLISIIQKEYPEFTYDKLINFITVASFARSEDGYKLFEAKYHMFLRGFNGIYVTLYPGSEKLYMTKPDEEDEDGNRIFSISFCSNCNALYLVGKRNNNIFEQKTYYTEDEETEIYLISSNEYDEDDNEKSSDNEYWLCTKCGTITQACSGKKQCEHEENAKILVIRQDGTGENSQLKRCPCCHAQAIYKNIFRPFVVGQAVATSVIATALYQTIPDRYFKDIDMWQKQFLTFSDSRQQAAYFASNLDYSYEKIIKKAAMVYVWNNKFNDKDKIKLSDFEKEVENTFNDFGIFMHEATDGTYTKDYKRSAIKAKTSVLNELVGFSKKDSMLNKRFFYFDIDIEENEYLNDISSKDATTLLKIFTMDLIKEGIVTANEDPIYREEYDFLHSEYIPYITKDKFMPKSERNKKVKLLNKLFKEMSYEDILGKLSEIFKKLTEIVLKKDKSSSTRYRVDTEKIVLRRIKENSLYKCSECKTITPYNIMDICQKSLNNCKGHLEVWNDYEEELKDNHYRLLYENIGLRGLKAEEHTAQLDQERAKSVQNNFQQGIINALSCSTTFEMGIDLGSLETVFMRNVPPSTSNYTQRAGRAGRGKDSSAFVLTYCLNKSHDINYFAKPIEMINGTVVPPSFDINNEKILLRHIYASALSFYWKKHPDYYSRLIREKNKEKKDSSVKNFYYAYEQQNLTNPNHLKGYSNFKNYLKSNDNEDLKEYLKYIVKILDKKLQDKLDIDNFGWTSNLFEENEENENYPGSLYLACCDYIDTVNNINNVQNKIYDPSKKRLKVEKENVIEYLSRNNILPKYGFPVDLVTLYTDNSGEKSLENIDLQRSLNQAITEYAPDSKIIVNKQLCTSKYIKISNGKPLPKYYYIYCKECGAMNISKQETFLQNQNCCCCDKPLETKQEHFIIPKSGFTIGHGKEYIDKKGNEKGNPPEKAKTQFPERTAASDIYYIPNKENQEEILLTLENNKKIKIITVKSSSAELAIINKSDFYFCPLCGYSGIITPEHELPNKHYNCYGKECSGDFRINQFGEIEKEHIGHRFFTDAIIIEFLSSDIPFGREELSSTSKPITSKSISIMYSLIEGISRALNVSSKELDGSLYYYKKENGEGNFSFVLFDKTPGGAGYVTTITKPEKIHMLLPKVLQEAYAFVKNCPEKDCREESSCYGCMRNYDNQRYHELLKRKEVINFLEDLDNTNNFNIIKIDKVEPKNIIKHPSESSIEVTDTKDINASSDVQLVIDEAKELLREDLDIIEILEDLQESVDLENNDISFIKQIEKETNIRDIEKPYHLGKITIGNQELDYTLAWKNSKIIYFKEKQYTDFLRAKENITDWLICCPKSDNFEPKEIIKAIKEN